MSVEKLLVKLEANVKDYVRDMNKAKDSNDDLGDSSEGLKGKLGNVKQAMGVAAGAAAGFSAGVAALGSALTALTLKAADNRRELERMARQAKTSTGEFQALAFATKQYGVDADQVADITKDVSDRFGEFATAASGPFQDFADLMGMSKEEAQAAAEAFSEMSGPDAIQAMVSQMDSAGASGEQITFVLESMGSELSRLYPLFRNNGEEMARLTGRFAGLNDELSISEEQAGALTQVAEDFDLMTAAISKAGTAIGAKFAPVLSSMLNTVTEVVPEATNSLISFFNAFLEAEDLSNIQEINRQIIDTRAAVLAYEDALELTGENVPFVSEGIQEQIDKGNERIAQLEAQKDLLQSQTLEMEKQAEVESKSPSSPKVEEDTSKKEEVQTNLEKEQQEKAQLEEERRQQQLEREREQEEARLEMLKEYALTKEEILIEQYQKEMEMLAEYQQATGASDEELYARRLEAAQKFRDKMVSLKKDDADTTEDTEKKKEATLEDGLRTARMVGNALFEDNKLVKAGLIVADTAAGIMRSIATYGLPQAAPFVAATAALGLAQLANVQSATKGGGTVSGGGAGGTSVQNRPEDFAPETTDLTIESNIEGVGTSVNRVSLSVEDSDDFIEELADRINRKRG